MRPIARQRYRGVVVIATAAVLASCTSVTRTSSLASEPAQTWIRESSGSTIVVEPPGRAITSGKLVETGQGAVGLQVTDSPIVEITPAPGTNLRDMRRGTGAVIGVLVGAGVGALLGAFLSNSLGSPNPDSAGGVEHPPAAVMVPLGVIAGILVGGLTGTAVGAERRLELRPDPSR